METSKSSKLVYPSMDQFGNVIPYDTLYIPFIYKEILVDKVYEGLLRPDMTIVDIGANMGITVEHFQPFAKRLLAVEPSSEYFFALGENKKLFNWDNVELFNLAIADRDGEMEFVVNTINRTMNTLVVNGNPLLGNYAGYANKFTVQTRTIDTFFSENGVEKVDFMKLDTEGAEDMILRSEGFRKVAPNITAFEAEFHLPQWEDLMDYVKSLGFEAKVFESLGHVILFTRSDP